MSVTYTPEIENGKMVGCTETVKPQAAILNVPEGISEIAENAFSECANVTIIKIPASVKSFGDKSFDCFNNCGKLEAFKVSADNKDYTSVDGVLFDKEMKTLIRFPRGKNVKEYEIPKGVTRIAPHAFSRNHHLTYVAASDTVVSIERGAFAVCSYLKGVALPAGLKRIGEWAFQGCCRLRVITIPASVEAIGSGAFSGCSGISERRGGEDYIGDWRIEQTFAGGKYTKKI